MQRSRRFPPPARDDTSWSGMISGDIPSRTYGIIWDILRILVSYPRTSRLLPHWMPHGRRVSTPISRNLSESRLTNQNTTEYPHGHSRPHSTCYRIVPYNTVPYEYHNTAPYEYRFRTVQSDSTSSVLVPARWSLESCPARPARALPRSCTAARLLAGPNKLLLQQQTP